MELVLVFVFASGLLTPLGLHGESMIEQHVVTDQSSSHDTGHRFHHTWQTEIRLRVSTRRERLGGL